MKKAKETPKADIKETVEESVNATDVKEVAKEPEPLRCRVPEKSICSIPNSASNKKFS